LIENSSYDDMNILIFLRFAIVSAFSCCYKLQSEQQHTQNLKNRREEILNFPEHLKTLKLNKNSQRGMQNTKAGKSPKGHFFLVKKMTLGNSYGGIGL